MIYAYKTQDIASCKTLSYQNLKKILIVALIHLKDFQV